MRKHSGQTRRSTHPNDRLPRPDLVVTAMIAATGFLLGVLLWAMRSGGSSATLSSPKGPSTLARGPAPSTPRQSTSGLGPRRTPVSGNEGPRSIAAPPDNYPPDLAESVEFKLRLTEELDLDLLACRMDSLYTGDVLLLTSLLDGSGASMPETAPGSIRAGWLVAPISKGQQVARIHWSDDHGVLEARVGRRRADGTLECDQIELRPTSWVHGRVDLPEGQVPLWVRSCVHSGSVEPDGQFALQSYAGECALGLATVSNGVQRCWSLGTVDVPVNDLVDVVLRPLPDMEDATCLSPLDGRRIQGWFETWGALRMDDLDATRRH